MSVWGLSFVSRGYPLVLGLLAPPVGILLHEVEDAEEVDDAEAAAIPTIIRCASLRKKSETTAATMTRMMSPMIIFLISCIVCLLIVARAKLRQFSRTAALSPR